MNRFVGIIDRIAAGGLVIGSVFLLAIGGLIIWNVVWRLFGHFIPGIYEYVPAMMVITGGLAIGYAAVKGSHLTINIVVSRFRVRTRAIVAFLVSLVSLGLWALAAWVGAGVLLERWLNESTQIVKIPYLPLRFALLYGLIILCLALLADLFRSLGELRKR